MRKFALLALLAAALAVPSIAAAAMAQGKLTGAATIGDPLCCSNFIIVNGQPVTDGGTTFVGLENDRSGNCVGDSGQVLLGTSAAVNVVCAHYVASSGCCSTGSPKMRFAVQLQNGGFLIFRITDNGVAGDTWAEGQPFVDTLAQVTAWVNTGRIGAGFADGSWLFASVAAGDFTVTAAQ
jgi:hypothetical protein